MNTNYCGSSICKNGCVSEINHGTPCAYAPENSARIVQAKVNGIDLWRVYVNMEHTVTFPTQEEAIRYSQDFNNNNNNEKL